MSRCAWPGALLLCACLQAPPAAAGRGDAGPQPLCGTTRVVRDQLDAESWAWQRYGSTALEGGRVQLYASPGDSAGMDSSWWYQLAGGDLTMELASVGVADGKLVLYLMNQDDDLVGLELTAGTLSLVQEVGGERTAPAAVGFAPDMLWWRLTEADGRLTWATATDGTDWIERGSAEVELEGPVMVLVQLSAGSSQAEAQIESFSPAGEEDACPAAGLTDDFAAPSDRWLPSAVADCSVTADGALVMAYDGLESCGVDSAQHFDMRGSQVAIEVVDAGDCDPFLRLGLELDGLEPELICVAEDAGATLHARAYGEAGSTDELATIDFDPDAHRLWRIRHDPGAANLVFEVAGAAGDWRRVAVAPVEEDRLRSAGVAIVITDDAADGDPGPVSVDRLNLVP